MTPRPVHELPDATLAALLERLGRERGGCLRTRILRAEVIRAIESEQDRRSCERMWALPVGGAR